MKNLTLEVDDFVNKFVEALKDDNAAIFAGAGLSLPSGYLDWEGLLSPIAKKLKLNIKEEHDYVALAQYFVDEVGGRGELNQLLKDEFSKSDIKVSENHRILARLPIKIFWTTNYDDLIEKALSELEKTPDVKRRQQDLSINLPRRDAIIYKMHGDLILLDEIVMTKHDYEDYYKVRELFSNAFKTDFVSRTMLFIGFSFIDPNLDYLISRIRTITGHSKRPDYYFIKIEKNLRNRRRQQLRANTLKKYGLYPVWVKEYSDITDILREIERRYLRSTIFISGSAHEYGPKWKSNFEAEKFIYSLSRKISSEKFKIVTGFGLGVGSSVINGALDNMKDKKNKNIDHYLILRPFPQTNYPNPSEIQESWKKYRESFIPLAGIAIFMFGNKIKEKKIKFADGMRQEFEIAIRNNLKIVPIGITGYVAKEIWDELMKNFKKYYPEYPNLISKFKKLGNNTVNESIIIETVIEIIKKLNKK